MRCPPALKPTLRFPQKYSEEVLSATDPSQPPPPPLQHFLEQPVQRVQQYQALLKVGRGRPLARTTASWARGWRRPLTRPLSRS